MTCRAGPGRITSFPAVVERGGVQVWVYKIVRQFKAGPKGNI